MQLASMKVILGRSHISAFVAAPKTVQILGIVRLGMEFGLLGLNEAGTYLRVNGSRFEELDRETVRRAIQLAEFADNRSVQPQALKKSCAPAVVVIRKQRRVVCSQPGLAAALTA